MEYLILLISLAGIVFGADFLVAGAVSIARKFKVSDFVIGAAIVGVGTSMPELVVSFMGALGGNPDVAIGNVVGSNIFNVLGILGVTALFFPVALEKKNLRFEVPVCILLSILLTFMAVDLHKGEGFGVISSFDGILLLIGFAGFMWYSFLRDRKDSDVEQVSDSSSQSESLFMAIVKVIGGLALLILSSDFFVDNAVLIAKSFGVNDAFISLTLIACGTSLPELAASVAAALKKNTDMAFGNIIGSNIFNISLILGLSSQVLPLTSSGITLIDYGVMIFAALLPLIFGLRGKIGRVGGGVMFMLFVLYNIYLIFIQTA